MSAPRRALPVIAALLATTCWGAGMTLTKLALGSFEPSLLLVVQLLASIGFLVVVAPILRVRWSPRACPARIAWLGILEPGLAYFLGLEGLQRISAAEAVVLSSTESILVVLLAWWWVREKPRGAVLALAGVGCVGAILVAGSHLDLQGVPPSLVGDALLIGGVLCASAYVVLSSRWSSVTEPLSALVAQQMVAVLLAAVLTMVMHGRAWSVPHASAAGWGWAIVSGIVQYACAFWFYLWALKGMSASVAGLFLNLIPVFGLLIALPVLGDRLSATQWLGALLILGSVGLLTWAKESAHEHEAGVESPTVV